MARPTWRYCGELPYAEALALQLAHRDAILNDGAQSTLFLLTHPHTVTIGRHGKQANVLAPALLEQRGCQIHQIDRGGDVTYHGPGQLVGYPVFDLGAMRLGVRRYLERLANALAHVLAGWGVEATWDGDEPGLWVGRDKVVAFGVHVHKNVAIHGFAMNLDPDLSFYDLILPCGLRDRGVTSVARLTGGAPSMDAAVAATAEAVRAEFFG